ncbi:MAG: hypothetical protein M1830_009784 [Pleopsidium flavum]|nr:MAG: hypothetical protein M1830_009784 [Pleopsidium flavum]
MDVDNTTGPSEKTPTSSHAEPRYGARLLPKVVDDLAQSNPKRIYASIPYSSDLSQGFRDVTMLEVAQAVDYFAWWLDEHIGRSTNFETLSYMGIPDLRYPVVFLAAVKCGYKLLLPSMRNSTWMNVSLLEQTGCTKFFYSTEMTPKVHDLQAAKKDLQIFDVQPLDDMIQGHTKHYPYEEAFEDVRWNPILVLHSSGSTGPPKPIPMNHGTFAVADNDRNLPIVKGRKNQNYALWNFPGSGGRYFSSFPPFHLGGFVSLIVIPIYSTTATVVLGPADKPSTGQMASQIMHRYHLRALFCPPTIFEQLVQEPQGLEQAKRLDFLLYAGGPLSTNTGNLLSQVTDVCQFYGQTETGAVQALVPLREDWASLEWHPKYGADMQPSMDDAYEMVLHRDPNLERIRGLSCTFPDVEEWHTKDLFRPHPSKPNLWQFHGRTDDIIVLSNGEKFNPVPSEGIIAGHPLLIGALIVGQGKFQAALLVEPKGGVRTDSLIEDIWPTIEQANLQAPGHGRIIRSMVAVAEPAKPFERAGKGTVIRKQTAEKFASEIEALYSNDNLQSLKNGPTLAALDDLDSIQEFVRACINSSFSVPDINADDDLYVLGLDSLKTVEITAILKAGLKASDTSWLSSQTLYANPTIHKLSKVIDERLNSQATSSVERIGLERSRTTKMASLVQKYTQDLPQTPLRKDKLPETSKLNVVLTGSTGSLGIHLLRALLDDTKVTKIYCLNRSANAQQRHEKSFAKLGLKYDLDSQKVEFIQADYGQSQFGLPADQFGELTRTADVLIHNAWKVDFNHSLESFEPIHIRGVRNFIDWSIRSERHPHIIFISSISSIGNWATVHVGDEPVPETPITSHEVAQEMGYGESKNVSERILGVANEECGVPVSILRVGQIAGPLMAKGVWNKDEWLPSLIKTSKSLSSLPSYIPDIDWIPVDKLATIILEIVHFGVTTDKARIYNILNPKPIPWMSLVDTIRKRLGPHIQLVQMREWIETLERLDGNDARELNTKPAMKILDFYRGLVEDARSTAVGLKYSTAHGVAASKTMAELAPVNAEWMDMWLDQLGY